mmetsp:Transcript_25452/g.38111  ORF Transcript_25452/g.38111 Transcript_25452/m.38111 type:complete len:130 (+) Transcript_25452:664-1053(+)
MVIHTAARPRYTGLMGAARAPVALKPDPSELMDAAAKPSNSFSRACQKFLNHIQTITVLLCECYTIERRDSYHPNINKHSFVPCFTFRSSLNFLPQRSNHLCRKKLILAQSLPRKSPRRTSTLHMNNFT